MTKPAHQLPVDDPEDELDVDKLVISRLDLGQGESLNIGAYLRREYDDVSVASHELPAILEWVHCQLQDLTERKILAEATARQARAKTWFALQHPGPDGFAANYHGKMTNEALAHAVELDAHVIKAEKILARYAAWVQRLHNCRTSIQAKLDLVRSSEATRRRVFDEGGR